MARPERRRRGDLVAAALIVVSLVVGGALVARGGSGAGTTLVLATPPISAPRPVGGVPAAFTQAWRAPSAASSTPVVAGTAAVTADGSAVVGRDATTGAERWRYSRDLPLCAASSGFPAADGGTGRVLAVFANGSYCSEMTAFHPETGARAAQRNPDVGLGARLLDGGSLLALVGPDYLEVVRSDLVKTLEYGAVPAPEQPGRQPRNGCGFRSVAMVPERLGVVERCQGEATDRLTVVDPDRPDGAGRVAEEFSVPLPAGGATVVAVAAERSAVALADPPRLQVFDGAGEQVGVFPLDVAGGDLEPPAPPGIAAVTGDDERLYWWTGSRTIALDRAELTPEWDLAGPVLGPAVPYADRLLVPVPGGLLPVDPESGTPGEVIPVSRPGQPGGDAVRLATLGEMLLEQRGSEVVALRPDRVR